MSVIMDEKPAVQNPAGTPDNSGGSMQNIVIGIIVVGIAALLAYQFLGCATCYMPISQVLG